MLAVVAVAAVERLAMLAFYPAVAYDDTPGYRRLSVAQQAVADSAGVRATVEREANEKGVALEQEAVEQMSATYAFKASLQTIKTQDQMLGSLLDVKA